MGSKNINGFLVKALLILMAVAPLLPAPPANAQETDNNNNAEGVNKNYAFSVWAAGGMYKNKFSFTFEGAYARNFNGFFGQVAVMANQYDGSGEYGLSLGIGQQNSAFEWYVFADGLHNSDLWMQLRGVFGVNLGWFRASGTYAVPLSKAIKIDVTRERRIEPIKKIDFSLIPFSWLRIYGNFYLFGKGNIQQKYDFGLEIRPLKIVSLRVDWNKASWEQESVRDPNTNWSLYSGWHMRNNFRIALNLILGSSRDMRQYPKKGNTRIIEVLWPTEVAGTNNSGNQNAPFQYYNVVKVYFTEDPSRVDPRKSLGVVELRYVLFDPEAKDQTGEETIEGSTRKGRLQMEKISDGYYCATLQHVFIQQTPYHPKHSVYIADSRYYLSDLFTAEGIEVSNSTETEIKDGWFFFKMIMY